MMAGARHPPAWTTPADIAAALLRYWSDGRMLAARLSGAPLFPLELALRTPSVADMGAQFDAVRLWIRALDEGSKSTKGHGYDIVWRDINHRQIGRNSVPAHVVLASEADALRLLGRQADAQRFDRLAGATRAALPQLAPWMARRPMVMLDHAAAWERVIAVLQWFLAHPRPQLYLRQLDVEGVDSKFIEARKGLLAELLDQVLPPPSIDDAYNGARQFEARYGLLGKPPLIRFRILDPRFHIGGMSDLAVPVAQFAALKLDVQRVYVTENEINGLAFPAAPSSIVIFGGGYAVDRLADIAWLRDKQVHYWGDIDTHGFAILDRLRASMPHAQSLLMDAATLLAHRQLWGREDEQKRFAGTLTRLTDPERQLFVSLRDNEWDTCIRMEQERLGYTWVCDAIAAL